MSEPRWLSRRMVGAFHQDQLRQHLGRGGIRDENLLEAALARPQQKWHHGERDLVALAAAYGFGIVRNHPFIDGTKRVGFVALTTFLSINGFYFRAPQEEVVVEILALAAGQRSENELAEWIRRRVEPR